MKLSYSMIAAAIVAAAAALGGSWYWSEARLHAYAVSESLRPAQLLLQENMGILQALKNGNYAESESQLFDAYLARIRKDGVPASGGMRQQIDQLVNNNTLILALLSQYAPQAHSPAFRASVDRFRDYAIPFRDRWQTVFEIFMAGGHLPAAGPSLPPEVAQAVAEEIGR